jgi:tetratricopeptide (TPR) repeat protein
MTDAERRSKEVKARRGPKPERDPGDERRKIEERTTEQWVDEGSVRDLAVAATGRAVTPPARRAPRPLDPSVASALVGELGPDRGNRLSERLAMASEALDRERYDEARRISASIVKEAPAVAAVQEVLGLASYRLGRYKQAAKALEAANELHSDPAMLPALADCYRAIRRWSAVERVWREIRETSPSQEIIAEGRIVAAGARADQDDLRGAIEVMEPATKPPKRVREHHLRQWYVLGDLYDRSGDPIKARRWFGAVASHDPDFADVTDRLRTVGR